ncbi:MAG: class I SAM-dependent methyltransferase [Planctomycetes bacterium]|nr:class I SAM-dependent methyltransferase [Planctomycetota bacterium]
MLGLRACTAEENHAWSLEQFVASLLREAPNSVLDVGCGAGGLMKQVADRGVPVVGVDQAGPKLEALQAEGADARGGSAYELPFDDGAFDWVTLRHVPHHLERPARAIAEAVRVCRTGVLIAEPAFDPSLPSQRTALQLDRWEKRMDRRGGMYHAEVHELGELVAMLPELPGVELELESQRFLRLRARSTADFAADARRRVAELAPDDAERDALDALLEDCARDGLSWNGSICLVVRRTG